MAKAWGFLPIGLPAVSSDTLLRIRSYAEAHMAIPAAELGVRTQLARRAALRFKWPLWCPKMGVVLMQPVSSKMKRRFACQHPSASDLESVP